MSISESGLAAIGKLTNLRSLELAYTNVNDQTLGRLAGLTNLEALNLDHTKVGGADSPR